MNDKNLNSIVCQSLDHAVESIDVGDQSNLKQARYKALESPKRNGIFEFLFDIERPKVVFASLLLAGLASFVMTQVYIDSSLTQANGDVYHNFDELQAEKQVNDVVVDDDVLLTEDDLDFYENLELYQWLDAEFG